MSERVRRERESEIDAGPVVVWRDVLDYVGWTVTDLDYIITPFLFSDPDDDGAPSDVYASPKLLRAWLLEYFPTFVCDGDACLKEHPGVKPGSPCGRTHEINARNRTTLEITHKLRAADSKRRWTPGETLAYLKENHD
jgi:hypothetical protein